MGSRTAEALTERAQNGVSKAASLHDLDSARFRLVGAGSAHSVYCHPDLPAQVIRVGHAERLSQLDVYLFPELAHANSASERSLLLTHSLLSHHRIFPAPAKFAECDAAPASLQPKCGCCTDCLRMHDALDASGSYGASYIVELKPKSGVLHREHTNGHLLSQFQRLQRMRFAHKSERARSLYDPAELFSFDFDRMVQTLLDGAKSSPRTNIQVWRSRRRLVGKKRTLQHEDEEEVSTVLRAFVQALLDLDILQRLLHVQHCGDSLNPCSAKQVADALYHNEDSGGAHSLRDYLLSAIAKDISIAVTLHEQDAATEWLKGENRCSVYEGRSGRQFLCVAHTVDISFKPISKLEQWFCQEMQLQAFENE